MLKYFLHSLRGLYNQPLEEVGKSIKKFEETGGVANLFGPEHLPFRIVLLLCCIAWIILNMILKQSTVESVLT